MGSRGGQGLAGRALEAEQRGCFQGTGLGTGSSVALRLQASPRPLVMPTWLVQGARCGLRRNLLGEKNFKIKKKKKKAQSTPFFSFSQPQSKSTVSAIEKSHLRSSTTC